MWYVEHSSLTTLPLQQVYPSTVAARSIAMHGCMISIGLSSGGVIICLDKRMLGGGPFEAKVAAADPSSASDPSLCDPALPSHVRQAAQALTACVHPYPALPSWVQSKCCSDVIFAGAPLPPPPPPLSCDVPSDCVSVCHSLPCDIVRSVCAEQVSVCTKQLAYQCGRCLIACAWGGGPHVGTVVAAVRNPLPQAAKLCRHAGATQACACITAGPTSESCAVQPATTHKDQSASTICHGIEAECCTRT